MARLCNNVCLICLYLCMSVASLAAQSCDRSFTANEETEQNAVLGRGLCTWSFTTYNYTFSDETVQERFRDALFKVFVNFNTVNLPRHDTCDVSNSIVIYDGADTSAPILGVVCRNATSTFESTRTSLTITYPASEVTSPSDFTLKFKQTMPFRCEGSRVFVVSETEYSLMTPLYPDGLADWPFECDYSMLALADDDRMRIVLETTATSCDNVSVEVYYTNRLPSTTMCPGANSMIQSVEGNVILTVNVAKGFAAKIKYIRLSPSPCLATFNATTQEQFLTTPGYPAPYESFTDCVWKIRRFSNDAPAIRIDVIESDMEETDGCTVDSLTLLDGLYLYDEVMATVCGSGPRSFYVYGRNVVVIFKSSRPSNTRKGIKIKYYIGEVEPCGGTVTANSTSQIISSPGFPFRYPDYSPLSVKLNHIVVFANSSNYKCTWNIEPEDATKFIEVDILVNDIFQAFSSCYFGDKLDVYDGSVSEFKLGRLCGKSGTPVYQGFEESMTLVFSTDSTAGNGGFKLSYKETEGPVSFSRNIESELREAKSMVSPRYPEGQISNVNATWTIVPRLGGNRHIMLTLTDVDLGDPAQCNTNFIKITSGPQEVSTLCGKDMGVFLSKGNDMAITMVSDNTLVKRGFSSQHEVLENSELRSITSSRNRKEGCNGQTLELDWYASHFESINYPKSYPNYANCGYIISAFSEREFLTVTIDDMDLVNSKNCSDDYFEFYDGNTTTSPLLARVCEKSDLKIVSTGQKIFVKFVSDSKQVGRGAKFAINSVYKELDVDKTSYLWVVILVCVLGGLVIVGFVIFKVIKKKRQG